MKYILSLLLSLIIILPVSSLDSIPEARWELVRQYLSQQKDLSAIMMVVTGGAIKINQGFGYADRTRLIPFSDHSLMTIGSITKPFTATAILLLMDQGKLSVHDPISLYFDNVSPDKKDITLHQLLTHSSGLPGAIGDDYEAISTLDFQKRVWEQTLLFQPGEGYEYSNVGYTLLGMIVEKVSGQSYSAFLEEKIFTPAGMSTAGYSNSRADYSHLVHGYMQDGSDWGTSQDKKWNGNEPYWNLKANGGLLMSAMDMYQWYLALRHNKVLTPALLKMQTTPYVDEGGGSFYGYGYALDTQGECVQHNGGNRIFKADFRWFPKADMFLFSATNDANVRLFRLNDEIIRILQTGELPEINTWEPIPVDLFPADENQYTVRAFIDMIQSYSAENADTFIPEYCTVGMVERNGKEKLHNLFSMLHGDIQPDTIESVSKSGENVQVVMKAKEENARLKITLSMASHKIDKLEVVMEGM
ncbi:MAG: beta-lactamase family protein [Saprospiraceae bacterium]|nr:beta-lactamase family protein [Saprospiraceae bacterium]